MARLQNRIAYAAVDPHHLIALASPSLQGLAAEPELPLAGRPLTEAFAELTGFEETLDELLAGRLPEIHLPAVNRGEGDEVIRYFNFSLYPLDGNRPEAGLLRVVEEDTISGRLQQELVQERNQLRLIQGELARANGRLQRLDQIKTLFLTMAAHDLRTPLSIINGYVDLLLDEMDDIPLAESFPAEDERWRGYLHVMQDQNLWLDRLIANIIDLNLIEQGRLVVHRRPYDLRLAVNELMKNLEVLLSFQKKQLEIEVPDRPVLALAEPDRVRQILQNLVGNSVKFIGREGRIGIRLFADEAQNRAVLCVSDNGPGIPAEHQRHLFKLFYRAPGVDTVQGTGLGLHIVKTLVEQHDGMITVDSESGRGTTFRVALPLADSD